MTSNNRKFQTISLFDIEPDSTLPFDLFVFFKGSHLLYRQAGTTLSRERFNRFILKKIGKLYVNESHYSAFHEYRKAKIAKETESLQSMGVTSEQKLSQELNLKIKSTTQELFLSESDQELETKLHTVLEVAESTVQKVLSMPYARAFESVPATQTDIIHHSIRVALLSTYLGYQLGFVNPIGLEYLAAAAMLHDLGKTKIAEIDSLDDETEEEAEILRQHPIISVQMLDSHHFVPDEIKRIIIEHHEEREGTGYPYGIRGPKMLGLSKVFCIANTFDHLFCDASGDKKTRLLIATDQLAQMTEKFDLVLLPKAIKLLKSGI